MSNKLNLIHYIPGGADIDPSLYNEPRSPKCHSTYKEKDIEALKGIDKAVKANVPILGICRGLQLLNVHQGGKMIQHIDYQGNEKPIKDAITGEQFLIPKAHHQVCILPQVGGDPKLAPKVIAYSYVNNVFIPEIVFFPAIKALGIQGHPEWMSSYLSAEGSHGKTHNYLKGIVKQYLDYDVSNWRAF